MRSKAHSLPSEILLSMFTIVNQSYFMGLFFMISGHYAASSVDHKRAMARAAAFLGTKFLMLAPFALALCFVIGHAIKQLPVAESNF